MHTAITAYLRGYLHKAASDLSALKQLKAHSDRGDYAAKQRIFRELYEADPDAFEIEDEGKDVVGVTHRHTGFRFHMKREAIPDTRPYRDRSEIYALMPGGKIHGGIYSDDGAFGVYGGGIDPGEDPLVAAVREYAEEAGYVLKNPKVLPVPPYTYEWKPPYDTEKQKERSKHFRGSRTFFIAGQRGEPFTGDRSPDTKHDLKAEGAYSVDEALKYLNPHRTLDKPRLQVLTAIRNMLEAGELGKEAGSCAINSAAGQTCTDPTEAQKKAGNYKKGRIKLFGFEVAIENAKGSYRSGRAPNGKVWRTRMPHHYGYFLGTKGPDKDQVDVFIGPHIDRADKVYVVDQIDPRTGKYDEPKCMAGFLSSDSAQYGYLKAYEPGWKGLGAITPMAIEDFKRWVVSPASRKPVAL